MSVLKSLRGTIVGVQHDLSTGFKNLRHKKTDGAHGCVDSDTSLDAGADLLNKFQTHWAQLHEESEKNALAAEEADGVVTDIFLYLERQNDAVSQFLTELSSLPALTEQLDSVVTKLGQLSGEFAELESQLLQLEDAIETHELHENKQRNEHQLALYRQKKDVELEIVKVKLARQNAEKSQQYESRLQETLMVRQKAFEEAYSEEIQNYKMYGQTQFKRSPTEDKCVELGDITLDADAEALDDFLNSDDDAVPSLSSAAASAEATHPAASHSATDAQDDPSSEVNDSSGPAELSAPDDTAGELSANVEVLQDEDYEESRTGDTVASPSDDNTTACQDDTERTTAPSSDQTEQESTAEQRIDETIDEQLPLPDAEGSAKTHAEHDADEPNVETR